MRGDAHKVVLDAVLVELAKVGPPEVDEPVRELVDEGGVGVLRAREGRVSLCVRREGLRATWGQRGQGNVHGARLPCAPVLAHPNAAPWDE